MKIRKILGIISITVFLFFVVACNQKVEVTINFDSNGGTAVNPITTDGKSVISIPDDPTKDGFEFGGWYWDNNTFNRSFTANSLLDAPISSNMTVYAKWILENDQPVGTISVTFVANGGTNVPNQNVSPGSKLSIPQTQREGHTLDGWYTSLNEGETFDERWSFANNTVDTQLVLYAKWEINKYTIIWKNYDGTVLEISEEEWGNVPRYNGEIPSRASTAEFTYTFSNWNPSVGSVNGTKTYIAQFSESINSYMVVFKDYDENVLKEEVVIYGDGATAPEEPIRDGYDFSGWDVKFDIITGELEVKAVYTIRKFNVIWKNYDGVILYSEKFEYGKVPVFNGDVPEKDPSEEFMYLFDGWSPEVNSVLSEQEYVATYVQESIFDYAVFNNRMTITGIKINGIKNVIIPETINGKEVKSIATGAFYLPNQTLESILIPKNIVYIESEAIAIFGSTIFVESTRKPDAWNSRWNSNSAHVVWGFTGFTSDDSLEYALGIDGAHVYKQLDTSQEKNIIIPDSVEDKAVKSILSNAFKNNRNIEKITLPVSLEVISSYAFDGARNLKEIFIPKNVIEINSYAFINVSSEFLIFVEESSRPPKWSRYWYHGFEQSIVIWGYTNHVDDGVLEYAVGTEGVYVIKQLNTSNENNIIIPNQIAGYPVIGIAHNAFKLNEKINNVSIPANVRSIGSHAFYGARNLLNVSFDDNSQLTSILMQAFTAANRLKYIILPDQVSYIGSFAFQISEEFTIYTNVTLKPKGWSNEWNNRNFPVYWKDQWHFNDVETPVPNE